MQRAFIRIVREEAFKIATSVKIGSKLSRGSGVCLEMRHGVTARAGLDNVDPTYAIIEKLSYRLPYWPRYESGTPCAYMEDHNIFTHSRWALCVKLASMTYREYEDLLGLRLTGLETDPIFN